MLKVLLKKQFAEVFRSFFYDQRKNRMRSKGSIALTIGLIVFLVFGVCGGAFVFMSIGICGGLCAAGAGWLYFVIMSGIAILAGTVGSVFNTFSGLYLPKDNDLLLSMPIPPRTIIISRLLNVYLLGTAFSSIALVPAQIVYWVTVGATWENVVSGVSLFVIVTLIVLMLSCLLGWLVARISLKLKNKSFVVVLISLAIMGIYYFGYYKAQVLIRELIANAAIYSANIKEAAYPLYYFGRIGEGDLIVTAIVIGIVAVLLTLTLFLLSHSFLKTATASAGGKKIQYHEKKAKQKSAFAALLRKEFSRFTSTPSYMLNCGMGVLLIPALGVFLLIKGADTLGAINMLFTGRQGSAELIVCTVLVMLVSMNDMAAPAVSLEGKSLWLLQSLPVKPRSVLAAKTCVQLILTEIPLLFTVICAAIVMHASAIDTVLICLLPLIYGLFAALFGTFVGVMRPVLQWTSEIVPIKQSGAVMISMFGGWGFAALFAAPYLIFAYPIGLTLYLAIWNVVFLAASVWLLYWVNTKGAEAFSRL